LVKIKLESHTGCFLNERSDEQVEMGYSTEDPQAFPGPQKFAFLSIRARSQVRTSARECKISIPRDSAPNHKVLKVVDLSLPISAKQLANETPFLFANCCVVTKVEQLPEQYPVAKKQNTAFG
jgi:hypothetical protein